MEATPLSVRSVGLIGVAIALGMGAGLLLSSLCGRPSSVVVQFPGTAATNAAIRVYVSGAVRQPGVYPLHAGDRVVDAVEAAGGPADDADTEAVNFALRVQDEQHLHLPRVGEPIAPQLSTSGVAGIQRVDINHADASLLRSLPGIGDARAANIVGSRQRDGLFGKTEELLERKLLTPAQFAAVKDLIEAAP